MVIETFCFNIVCDIVPPQDLEKKKNWFQIDLWLLQERIPSFTISVLEGLSIIANNHTHYSYHKLHFCFQNLTFYLYACEKDLSKCIYAAGFDFAAILLVNQPIGTN